MDLFICKERLKNFIFNAFLGLSDGTFLVALTESVKKDLWIFFNFLVPKFQENLMKNHPKIPVTPFQWLIAECFNSPFSILPEKFLTFPPYFSFSLKFSNWFNVLLEASNFQQRSLLICSFSLAPSI